ncbi:MAG TPA: nucleotidyltransferase domain-containing protein [Kofleriaceae bacterium]|nr:nucleotidyltransferase domain-containing protein [Kofleriaceae bacterium]
MVATPTKDALGHALDVRAIEQLMARIVEEFRPLEVRLIGSRARGDADADSDWDLFVIVPDDLMAADDIFAGYRLKRETRTRADVILCPISEFSEDRETPNTLAYEAAHHGVTVYER